MRLRGTIFVSQDGAIYAISGSRVRRLPLPAGGAWIQPRALPDGSLVVVRRFDEYSDLYHVSAAGKVIAQMTDNDQATSNKTLQLDHWVLWPAIGADGTNVYFATDAPKPAPRQSYEVDFSLWSAPISGGMSIGDQGVTGGTRWSVPDCIHRRRHRARAATGRQRPVQQLREHREGHRRHRARRADRPAQPDGVADDARAGLRCARRSQPTASPSRWCVTSARPRTSRSRR